MTTKTDFDLVLKSGKVMLPNGETITDIGIKDEKICHIGTLSNSQLSCNEENVIDCKNFHVFIVLWSSMLMTLKSIRKVGRLHLSNIL